MRLLNHDDNSSDIMVLHVDSRYRDKVRFVNSGHFQLNLDPIIQNVTAIRLSSIEMPNIFYTFSRKKKNNILSFNNAEIEIPQGNYTADSIVCALQEALDSFFEKGLYSVSFSAIDGRTTITNTKNQIFKLDESNSYKKMVESRDQERIPIPSLLYALGFRKRVYTGGKVYVSESIIDVVGPNYLIMHVNDFGSMRYRQYGVSNAFAKIILTNPKTTATFDNFSNFVSKQHNFHQPINLSRLLINITDPYEDTLDMSGLDYSLTFEILYVRNSITKDRIENDLMRDIWKEREHYQKHGFMGMLDNDEDDDEKNINV